MANDYNDTTWLTDANTKGSATSSTTQNVSLDGTLTVAGATQLNSTLSVGVNDTGYDVKFFGATSGKYMEWDESSDQLDVTGSLDVTGNTSMIGTLTVGVDDTGHDVKFFGATSGSYMLWDESLDNLVLTGVSRLGIGTITPSTNLHIYDDTDNAPNIYLENVDSDSNSGGNVIFRSQDSNGDLVDNQIIGDLVWQGYNNSKSGGAGYDNMALIRGRVDGTPDGSDADMPGELAFYTCTDDGALTQRMAIRSSGIVTLTSYMVEGRTLIKIPATAFRANDDGIGVTHIVGSIEDDGSNFGLRPGSTSLEFYAYIDVPLGYTATKVKITGSDTANEVEVYTLDLDDGTIGSEISNSGLTVADDTVLASNHVGADDKMLLIKVATTAVDDIIYGGYVTIEAT